jgi:hypothetical protein
MTRSGRRRVRRRCDAVLRQLSLPTPFDVRALCEGLAAQRGRPIRLLPLAGLTGVCGLWIATDTTDFIAYEQHTTPPHQDHIVLHEIGHMLCEHYPATVTPAEQARLLLPSLDPAMVRRVLGRTGYTSVEEQEAEIFASLVGQRREFARTSDPLTDRLRSALDDGGGHG